MSELGTGVDRLVSTVGQPRPITSNIAQRRHSEKARSGQVRRTDQIQDGEYVRDLAPIQVCTQGGCVIAAGQPQAP